jgi:anti-sigma factor ChrR (cupin superfamily)
MNPLDDGELVCLSCEDLPWKPSAFAAGVSVKDVAVSGGLEMQLVRFQPGTRLPLHQHEIPEFIYVLEGELSIAGQRLSRGWASVASAGSVHADVHSDSGCVFVLVDRPL